MDFKSNLRKSEEFIIVLSIILSGFIVSAVFKINNYLTFPNLDEMLWYGRSSIFWDKMFNFDFSGLIQSAQPGITVYWFTGFMMKFISFDFGDVTRRIAEKEAEGFDFNSVINVDDQALYSIYQTISFIFNTPLFLLTVVFFISFYYLLRKLGFNKIISYFSLLFLTTNMFLARWTTPSDKMLDIFMTLSFLTFLVYVDKFKEKKYLYMSAIFGAWAVLSKLSALFLLPFFFSIFIYFFWPINKEKIKIVIKDYLSWILIFIVVITLFLPTIVTNPKEVYDLVFNSKHVFEESYKLYDYAHRVIFEYLKTLGFMIIGYTTQMSTLSLIAYFVIRQRKKYKHIFSSLPKKNIQIIEIYIILFFIMVTLMSSNHDIRFMSPIFVILNVISAVGLYGFLDLISRKIGLDSSNKNVFCAIVFVVAVLSQLFYITSSGMLIKDFLSLY